MSEPNTILVESITPMSVGFFAVRVWRQEAVDANSVPLPSTNDDLYDLANALHDSGSAREIMERFCALERVNAVEVLDADKHGLVGYVNWP